MSIGYDVIYPGNCKEVHEGLKTDELKRRLMELSISLESMSEVCSKGQDSLLNVTQIDDNGDLDYALCNTIDLRGLFLHLTNEQFIDHQDSEVQVRVAVCLCHIIKITCPNNPFSCYSDNEVITKSVLHFLLKCIKEFARIKTKNDRLFMPLYTVLSICCEIDIFHFYTAVDGGSQLLSECFHVFFDVVKRSNDWCEDTVISRMITDAIINLLSSSEVTVSEDLVTYLLNVLVDRSSSKVQKQISLDIFTKCSNKLEEQIQTVLQSLLIKTDKEEDLSDSSDDEEVNNEDDDFCSLDSYKLKLKKSERIKPKSSKVELFKGTINLNIEYACHHVFQMIFEMFKINQAIITPLLSTIEMKLRSTLVTDRKRACRLIGKLFSSSNSNDNPNQCFLWETFLGRFSDIELEVREICIRIARDLLKGSLENPDNCGIMILEKEKEELIKAFQKRSNDQEESIRYLVVLAVSQILEHSKTIIEKEDLDAVTEAMFKLLIHQSRDKFLSVRKEAHSTMGKLYKRIIVNSEKKSNDNSDIDLTLGLRNLSHNQKIRVELLLNLILRQYLSVEVEDRILVERLFNTSLVPYSQDSLIRMKSLLQCLTLTDEPSTLCIHEMFKTQVTVMNLLRQTVNLIGDVSSDRVMSSTLSQKLREKVKKLAEFLSSKDKIDSLTKLFNQARSDKRLNELLQRFVNKDSSRQVIVKCIMDIRKHFTSTSSKFAAIDVTSAAAAKRKIFVGTIKCIFERGAPILFDPESVQELLSHCVVTKEAMEFSSFYDENVVSLSRTLNLLHTLLLMSKKLVPLHEAYEYLVSIMTSVCESNLINAEKDKSNGVSKYHKYMTYKVEELCLMVFSKMVDCPRSTEKVFEGEDTLRENTFFSSCSESLLKETSKVLVYLERRCLFGSAHNILSVASDDSTSHSSKKEHKVLCHQDNINYSREMCQWKYDCKVAKLASHCIVNLLLCCQREAELSTDENNARITALINEITSVLNSIVNKCCECQSYSDYQHVSITSLTYITVNLPQYFVQDIRTYATDVVPKLLADDVLVRLENQSKNLSLWQLESDVSKNTQVKIQSLKLLSRWVVTLKADETTDQKCIVYVMSSLRKYIGSYGMEEYSGDVSDKEMSHLRLAAGKCWLRIAQMQSFLPIFDVKWIYKLSSLVYDPCPQVRDEFLRKLHMGLFKLKLPLEYMAMFVFVPKVKSPDYLNVAKKYLQTNISRRREFLDTYPEYLNDAKKLFGILPEYVLSFMIHMLAHDPEWKAVNIDDSLLHIKHCLWFVMEPILKLNENYSFIRKLLEKIKHAQDAADPNNMEMNEKLYICSDIALGLLITKQSSYDLKEYPVELKLPRTRYVSAPNTFFNPDFASILLDNNTRARIQFSPVPKSKQMIKNCMPTVLIKGNHSTLDLNKGEHISDNQEFIIEHKPAVSKTKKYVAKIVVGLPEMESEYFTEQPSKHKKELNVRKHKISRIKSPQSDINILTTNQISVTKRGRVCKPNFLVMKDMVSPSKKSIWNINKSKDSEDMSGPCVRIEGIVSINLEQLMSEVINQTLNTSEYNKESIVERNKDMEKNILEISKSKVVSEFGNQDRKTYPIKKILNYPKERSTKVVTRKDFENSELLQKGNKSLKQSKKKEREFITNPLLDKERITRNSIKKTDSLKNLVSKEEELDAHIVTDIDKSDLSSQDKVAVLKDVEIRTANKSRRNASLSSKLRTHNKLSKVSKILENNSPKSTPPIISSKIPLDKKRITRTTSSRYHLLAPKEKKDSLNDSLEKEPLSPTSAIDISRLTKKSVSKIKLMQSQEKELTSKTSPRVSNVCTLTLTEERKRITRSSPEKSNKSSRSNFIEKEVRTNLNFNQPKIRNVGKPIFKESQQNSPIEFIVRSKRLASQVATEELAKKIKKM